MNALRTSILFLMLYLIYTRADHASGSSSRCSSTRSSSSARCRSSATSSTSTARPRCRSNELPGDPRRCRREPRPANPVPLARPATLAFEQRHLHAPVGDVAGGRRTSRSRCGAARRSRSSGPSGAGQDDARQAAGRPLPPAGRRHPLQRARRTTRVDLDELRERIGFVTQDTQLFSGTIRENLLFVRPDGDRRRVPRGAAARRPATACCARAERGPRHGDRRGRRQGVGRREAAAVDRARAAAAAAPAGLRRGHLVARLAHRGGDRRDDPRGGRATATSSRS